MLFVLPGLVQTAHRAELFAVAAVLEICLHQAVGGKIRIWSDCMSVVVKFQLLLSGQWKPSLSQPHSDLWQWVCFFFSVTLLAQAFGSRLSRLKPH